MYKLRLTVSCVCGMDGTNTFELLTVTAIFYFVLSFPHTSIVLSLEIGSFVWIGGTTKEVFVSSGLCRRALVATTAWLSTMKSRG
jgi:hypothetical protein